MKVRAMMEMIWSTLGGWGISSVGVGAEEGRACPWHYFTLSGGPSQGADSEVIANNNTV